MRNILIYLVFAALAVLAACQSGPDRQRIAEGAQLSKSYCIACHAYPDPGLLDRATWEKHVLPRMGYFYGIYQNPAERKTLIEDGLGGEAVEAAKIFPEKPLLDTADFSKIVDFYLAKAPEKLDLPQWEQPEVGIPGFSAAIPEFKLSPPSATLAYIRDQGGFFVGDANSKRLYEFDRNEALVRYANLKEGPVWVEEIRDFLFVTVMGSFSPTDAPSGTFLSLTPDPQNPVQIILPYLQRPVHSALGDFNGDGNADILTCEFAKWTGGLSWWENKGTTEYVKHLIRSKPGATKAYIRDFNDDTFPDVIALFGQGDEGIFIYYNDGKGHFREEKALGFPPSYGSSFFDLTDFNGDGFEDIIYTAGDNADYPPILKPYHGVRIFLNDGKHRFNESFFFHLPGAYNAVAEDFDLDGDRDIAAISFFPDFQNHPEQGFVYLQNQGGNRFKPFGFAEAAKGRWIVMSKGDIEQDGDTDLLLGSLAFEIVPPNPLLQQWIAEGIPFVVLKNQMKK